MPALDIPSLLERDAELAELAATLDGTRAPLGRVVVIEGPAGIGKTRLLAEAAARGRANGMTVLTARASELEREFGYGVVRQLFERALSELPAEERADVLCCAAQPAAAVLVAEVPDAAGGTPRSAPCTASTGWRR